MTVHSLGQPEYASARRRPRILLISEFFPVSVSSVSGAFQRLQTHFRGLREVGRLDVVFLWPEGRSLTQAELEQREADVRQAWQIEGSIWFVPVDLPDAPLARVGDVVWALRGAISFLPGRPTMRSTRRGSAAALARILDATKPDLIFAHRLGAAGALLRAQATTRATAVVVLDLDDVEHVRLERQARATRQPIRKARAMAWRALAIRAERQLTAVSSLVLVCSEADRQQLVQICPDAKIGVVPNTAKSFETGGAGDGQVLAFFGTALYPPNREGILWFVDHVWERIRTTLPAARLLIAGEGTEGLGISSRPGVEVLGFVGDLEPVYRAARLVICPIRRGSGTRIKIIEAALSGRAVVSTTIGAEGLGFGAGTEITLADTPTAFVSACVVLLTDPLRAAAMAGAARDRARALYSRERVAAELAGLCRGLLRGKAEPAGSHAARAAMHERTERTAAPTARRGEPKVSIIIGLYNAEAYVARCLDSVVGQTLGDMEVILVDDASRDGTLDIAEAYARRDKRVRILRQDTNLGQSAALNRGFAEATGTTVRFVDNDDVLPLDSSEALYAAYERHRPQIVRGHAQLFEDGVVRDAPWIAPAVETHRARFADCDQLWSYLGGVWRHLFDREFLAATGILHSEDVRIGQDHVFNVRAYDAAESISIIEECIYVHDFASTDSLTRSRGDARAYRDEAVSLARTSALLRPYPLPYLMDATRHLGYRVEMLRSAVRDLNEPRAKLVIAALSEIYRPVEAEAAGKVLTALRYAVPTWSESTLAVARQLHRGEIDAAYERLRPYVA